MSIDAIDIDLTATDQTDWLYATPVTDVNEDKASVAVTMNHALANINVKVNKGSYLGAGNITNITLQSDGIALGSTFNAAQTIPGYTAFEDEGKPLSRTVSTSAGAAATDIMVVPSGKSAAVTFLLTIDGIQFTATSAAVQLAMGNSYQYTLNLSDISTYMEISGFSVKDWSSTTGGTLDLNPYEDKTTKVYAVSSTGELIDYNSADATATGVALVAGEHKSMIAKSDATDDGSNYYFYYQINNSDLSLTNYSKVSVTNSFSDDFTTWKEGAVSDFEGKANTAVIAAASSNTKEMCTVLKSFNQEEQAAGRSADWYVPALGQLTLMYLNMTEINAALAKISGTALTNGNYWSSTEYSSSRAWYVYFGGGVDDQSKNSNYRLRFICEIE